MDSGSAAPGTRTTRSCHGCSSHRCQRGQGASEYVIALAAISLAALVILVNFGGRIQAFFGAADSEVTEFASAALEDLDPTGSLSAGTANAASMSGDGYGADRNTASRTRNGPSAASRSSRGGTAQRSGGPNQGWTDEQQAAFSTPRSTGPPTGDDPVISFLLTGVIGLLVLGLAVVVRLGISSKGEPSA